MVTLLLFLVVISLLVFIHELGHFLTARRLGVSVEEFGFGFPPRMIGFRRGGTTYSLNWIPFGGFVRLKGETPTAAADPDSFVAQPRRRRFAILAAGVVMNWILAIILFTIGLSIGLPAAQVSDQPDHRIVNPQPQITAVDVTGAAAQAGLQVGDIVLRADDVIVRDAGDLKAFEQTHGLRPFTLAIKRRASERQYTITPREANGEPVIGVAMLNVGTIAYPFPESLWEGTRATINVTGQILGSFGTLLRDLVVDRKLSQDLSGPVGVVVLTGQAYHLGLPYLIQFVALLSVTLAVVNFLPLPALDGGRALFVLIEAVRRRRIDHRIEALVHSIGFYALIALIVLISVRDVRRFDVGSRILEGVRNLIGGS